MHSPARHPPAVIETEGAAVLSTNDQRVPPWSPPPGTSRATEHTSTNPPRVVRPRPRNAQERYDTTGSYGARCALLGDPRLR
jgi:hypothetical protein